MVNRKKLTNKWCTIFFIILSFVIFANCDNSKKEIPHNPIQTALGELVGMDLKKEIQVNDNIITSDPGQLLLLLRFQGRTEIPYQSAGGRDDYYVIIDSTNHSSYKYIPIFVGAYDSTKKLSDQLDWKMNGTMTIRNGKTVFSGTIKLTSPEVVLLYKIPSDYYELYLKENENVFSLIKK